MSKNETAAESSDQAMALALRAIAEEAISACHGEPLARAAAAELGDLGGRPVHLVGAGKAAGAMARGVLAGLEAPVDSGLLVTKDDHFGRFASPSFLSFVCTVSESVSIRNVPAVGEQSRITTS